MLFPLSIAKLRNSSRAMLAVCLAYTVYVLYPAPSTALLWVTVVAVPVCTLALRHVVVTKLEPTLSVTPQSDDWKTRILLTLPLLLPLVVTFIAETQLRVPGLSSQAGVKVKDDRLSIIVSGFLLAVFVGGLLISYIVRPLANQAAGQSPRQQPAHLLEMGSRIGWLERALFFAFFVGGAPDAAALALTAKAFVRAPDAGGVDAKSEYYLVGSLASVAVALGVSVCVRLALGQSAI